MLAVVRPRTFMLVAIALFLLSPATAQATIQWVSPENISASGRPASQPDVDIDGSGRAYAVWSRNDGTTDRIQFATRSSNGVWGSAVTISDSGQNASQPKLAVRSNGDAWAVWTRFDGSKLRVQAAFKPATGVFGPAQTLSDAGQDAFDPQVSMDPQGNAVAVWSRFDGTRTRVQAANAAPGGAFTGQITLSEAGQDAFEPQTSAEPNGNAVAVWTRSDGTNLRIQSANRLDVPGYPRPQGASALRVTMALAYQRCGDNETPNRTHGPTLVNPSCNPAQQESSALTIGTTDSNGLAPQGSGSVKFSVCPNGTTGAGICSTPAGMSGPDVRIQVDATDVRRRSDFTDYTGRLNARTSLRITDRWNGSLQTDTGTTSSIPYNIPVQCTSTLSLTIGSSCNLISSANTILPGSVGAAKRAIWETSQITIRDAGANGTGYGVGCPPTCGDGDERDFMRQGIFVP